MTTSSLGTVLPADLTRDYFSWLADAGTVRLADTYGPDLDDSAVFAAAVQELFLGPAQPTVVDAFVDAHHGRTLQLVHDRLTLVAAGLDGSHAGGCG